MFDDEIDYKLIELLETNAKHEPDPDNAPITINDAKDHMINLLNIRRFIRDKSYHDQH